MYQRKVLFIFSVNQFQLEKEKKNQILLSKKFKSFLKHLTVFSFLIWGFITTLMCHHKAQVSRYFCL